MRRRNERQVAKEQKLFIIKALNLTSQDIIYKMRENEDHLVHEKKYSAHTILKAIADPENIMFSLVKFDTKDAVWDMIKESPFYTNNYSEFSVFELEYKGKGDKFFEEFISKK